MTIMQVIPDNNGDEVIARTTDRGEIANMLAPYDIRLDRWATRPLPGDADSDAVIAAYRAEVDEVCAAGGFRLVDVVRMVPDPGNEQWRVAAKGARERFLNEHRHAEHEVRFFVEGRGCFYLHLGDKVFAVVCEEGDLISVPAGTTHWFDMGTVPHFCAIRFFEEEDGWIGDFTGDPISGRMPTLDELLA